MYMIFSLLYSFHFIIFFNKLFYIFFYKNLYFIYLSPPKPPKPYNYINVINIITIIITNTYGGHKNRLKTYHLQDKKLVIKNYLNTKYFIF